MEQESKPKEENKSSNITSTEIDEETAKRLRGDAIGNTMYSERFILKTLLQFSDLQWSNQLEEDLCFLWDMTSEGDVCKYLFESSFPALAVSVLDKYEDNPRLLEILVGILANLLCVNCGPKLNEEEIVAVMGLFAVTEDSLILVQIMRFIHALSHSYKNGQLLFINDEIIDKFNFILMNSMNIELLKNSIKTLAEITSDFKLEKDRIRAKFVQTSTVAYKLINQDVDYGDRNILLSSKYFEIVLNVCAYASKFELNDLKLQINVFSKPLLDEIQLFFEFYSQKNHLLELLDDIRFFIDSITYIVRILQVEYSRNIVNYLGKLLTVLVETESEHNRDNVELFCYFLSFKESVNFKHELNRHAKKILQVVEKEQFDYDEFNYKDNLKIIMT